MRIILGSQSPRRKKVLNDAGYVIEVLPAHFDEESIRHAEPETLTKLLAAAKNQVLQKRVTGSPCIITADTVVTHDGRIYEKAISVHEAYEWITTFMDSTITVHTSHMVHDMHTGYEAEHTASAVVHFSSIPHEVRAQLALNAFEASVAGGFHMSDPLLQPYVRVDGDAATVLGLDIIWVKTTLIHIEKMHLREILKKEYAHRTMRDYAANAIAWVSEQKIFLQAERVYAYHPITSLEIPYIDDLMKQYSNKQWVFPEIDGEHIRFEKTETAVEHNCILVPALALSASGMRLGKGKGFYDRFLGEHPEFFKQTLSVIPDFALCAVLPVSGHDIPIAYVHGAAAVANF